MGQITSKRRSHHNIFTGNDTSYNDVGSPYGLSYDKQTETIYDGSNRVSIGNRCRLKLLVVPGKGNINFFEIMGIDVRTRGSRFSRNAKVVVSDYYRLKGSKLIKRNKQQGNNSSNWEGDKGPAEASGALRIGDSLYAINGRYIVNKTKKQALRMITSLMENETYPIVVTWKHVDPESRIPWELEESFPPPEGEYFRPSNEFGWTGSRKFTSVSI